MILKETITNLIEEKIAGTDIFIVDVSVSPSNKIVVLIDTDTGITVEKCTSISRVIESALNREVEDFELEVSSPGLSKPFKVLRQYSKNIGRDIAFLTKDNLKLKGRLISANIHEIELEVTVMKKNEKNKKVKEQEVIRIEFNQIKSAKVVISF